MKTNKLDQWADLLLDTGKRNNLINFKDTKSSTVEVLLPSPDILFEKIEGFTSIEIFDPKIVDKYEELITSESVLDSTLQTENQEELNEKEKFISQYANKIKRKNQILVYSTGGNPITSIRGIAKKARTYIEETGVNVAYMAFGFIHWKENNSATTDFHAPILLVPIRLERTSSIEPYLIKPLEDDIILNPTFSYKLDSEYGVKLPEYNDEGLTAYLNTIQEIVKKLQWTVTSDCKIGIFSFQKINMYRDLQDNKDMIFMNQNILQLLGEYRPMENELNFEKIHLDDSNIELHNVVDADFSQIEAIKMAKLGKSFVLQGPPGTGKSQTITNIIAECLNDGKKVLFVSEKLAALNVVYDKLKQVGLSEFCLPLHSHKAAKKDVINEICHTLRSSKTTVSSKAESEITIKEKAKSQLDTYVTKLHEQYPIINKSLYELYEAYVALRFTPDFEWIISQIDSKDTAFLAEVISLLEQFADYIPSIGNDYKKNVWYGFINGDISYQAKSEIKKSISQIIQLVHNLIPITQDFSEKYEVVCDSIEKSYVWKSLFDLLATSQIITPALLNKDSFEKVKSSISRLQTLSTDILDSHSSLNKSYDEDIYKLEGNVYHKKITKQFNSLFSRLFSSEYRQIITNFRLCKKDGKRISYKEALQVSKKLAHYQNSYEEYREIEIPIKSYLGYGYKGIETDWNYMVSQIVTLDTIFSKGIAFGKLTAFSDFVAEKDSFKTFAQKLDTILPTPCDNSFIQYLAECFDKSILNIQTHSFLSLLPRLQECLDEIDKLDNWCHFMMVLSMLKEKNIVDYIDTYLIQNLDFKHIASTFEKLFYYQWIDYIIANTPILSSFTRIAQDKAVITFREKDIIQFEITKAKIRAEVSSKRPSLEMISAGSSLALLLREGEKKRKQKSIRSLLNETGDIIQRVKPCFMMSPLSVSTFLTPNSVSFDVVIFDEASQVFPQDAIGAIYRAEQMIIVGDSKQMPPSNFFNSSVEINDDEPEDTTDFESILDLSSTNMQQLRLKWHYRSRYEQLIAFSNKNFYDNELVSFPSSEVNTSGSGIDYFYVDGIFDRKSHTNMQEAIFIVDLIYQNIDKYPNRSLGVVAFSIAQQDLIDKLLSKRRQNTPAKEFFFQNDCNEPFFIKNLETVQGDERDTIIFSIAYGKDIQGRLLHNFGPLNKAGGERRLNVAVTRAKCNVQLVSSMHYTDIDLKRTSSLGAKLLKEYLEFAEHGIISSNYTIGSNSFETNDCSFELEVCEFLRSKGFHIDTKIGFSDFKIDIGVKYHDNSNYALAIECDGLTYKSFKNTRDRDRLRQEILERMGWQYYRIWSTEWFRNKTIEQSRLLEIVTNAINKVHGNKKQEDNKLVPETFEENVSQVIFDFPAYKVAPIEQLAHKYLPDNFIRMIKEILEVESPLSEELLLKRIVHYFDREKVTNVVQRAYLTLMEGHENYGIIRRDGFLYLSTNKNIQFRKPGDLTRDIKQIAPEELASGLKKIIELNITVDKKGLYQFLATQCGISRITQGIHDIFDEVLILLSDYILVKGDLVSLKK